MTKAEYFKFHKEFCEEMTRVTLAKNADYTANNADPYANFSLVERLGIGTTEQGLLTRIADKFARIVSLVNSGNAAVKDESVADTLLDLANYSVLLAGYLKSKETARVAAVDERTGAVEWLAADFTPRVGSSKQKGI